MSDFTRNVVLALILGSVFVLLPEAAHAYGGPGSIISGIGTVIAVIAAVLASLFGFVWFPLKRLYRKLTTEEGGENE